MEYKAYLIDKRIGMVYGIITENEKTVGIHRLTLSQDKKRLVPSGPPDTFNKTAFKDDSNYEVTDSEKEAMETASGIRTLRNLL